jgi:diguanylate cyclase (GGDEF)-like protein
MILSKPRSLRASIVSVVVLASGLAVSLFTAVATYMDGRSLTAQLDGRLAAVADVVGQNSTAALDFNDRRAAQDTLAALDHEPQLVSACLYTAQGVLFAQYQRATGVPSCSLRISSAASAGTHFRSVTREIRHAGEIVGNVQVTASESILDHHRNRMLAMATMLALASLALAGLAGILLQKRISDPVVQLADAMNRVTRGGDLEMQVPEEGATEVAQLAAGFNRMLIELERRRQIAIEAQERLLEQARTDALTGLPNRRHLADQLQREVDRFQQGNQLIAVLYIDLDGFKLVNDSLGHATGDLLLCEVAKRLRSRVRSTDILARVGGDEFTLILTGLESEKDAMTIANNLIQGLASPFLIEGNKISVGASIGISTRRPSAFDDKDMLKQADSAMYAAKRSGKNRAVSFSPELGEMARERLTLEAELHGAVERGEVYVEYQPEWNASSGHLIRFEALARWRHPHLGEISPGDFIPVAEENGLIHRLGRFIMERACTECLEWQKTSPHPIEVAVNVSSLQFASETFVDEVAMILKRTGLKPELLHIELTESEMLGPDTKAAENLRHVRQLGVTLAIDDFGTGYSWLGYLPTLPFSALKIDRSFIGRIQDHADGAGVVRSLIDLARKIGVRVVAEGIENSSQLDALVEMGADEVQGYLLGLPSRNPRVQFAESLRGRTSLLGRSPAWDAEQNAVVPA